LNVFNHPNWATPGVPPTYVGTTDVSSTSFAQSGASNLNGARVIELRANISF
jgi:hypothetical protein